MELWCVATQSGGQLSGLAYTIHKLKLSQLLHAMKCSQAINPVNMELAPNIS
jgi:hypothetical protein